MSGSRKIERFGDWSLRYLNNYFSLWLCLVIASLFLTNLSADPDLFARVAAGRLVDLLGGVSLHDPFAFTTVKAKWIDHEWLSGWIFFKLTALGGDGALFVFKTLIAFYSVVFMIRAQRLVSPGAKGAALWSLLAVFNSLYVWTSTVRAQVFTYFFLPFLMFAFAEYLESGKRRYIALFPAIIIVWANAHGGFVLGLALFALFLLQVLWERRPALFPSIIFVVGVLCTLVNPYGIEYWNYIIEALFMPRTAISEWAPLLPLKLQDLFFHLMVVITIIGVIRRPKSFPVYGLAVLALSVYFAYKHMRLMAFFSISAAVFATPAFDLLLDRMQKISGRYFLIARRAASALAMLAVPLLLLNLCRIMIQLPSFSLNYSAYPVAAFDWLRNLGSGGKLLVDFNNGSYALWRLFPKYRISLDGRYEEVYPNSTFDEVSCALNASDPNWESCFRKVQADTVLVRVEDLKLQSRLPHSWRKIYADEVYMIFSTQEAESKSTDSVRPVWEALF